MKERIKPLLALTAKLSPQIIVTYLSYTYWYGYSKYYLPKTNTSDLPKLAIIQNLFLINILISFAFVSHFFKNNRKSAKYLQEVATSIQIAILYLLSSYYAIGVNLLMGALAN